MTNVKILHILLPIINVCDIVHVTLSKVQKIFRGKATSFAKSKMEEADHCLKKEKLACALASANLAVIRAPTSSKEKNLSSQDSSILPKSLYIRSEILFKNSEYKLSLNDVQLALKHHLPDKYKSEAYLRMAKCYLKLGDKNKSKISLAVASSCGDKKIKADCKAILQDLEKFLEAAPIKHCGTEELIECADGSIGITKSLVLSCDRISGKYYKAAAPIFTGEIVACEEPYVSVLQFDKHGTHCLECYKRLKSPIPCEECSGVAFCSINCLNDGMKYHKWECPYLELAIGSGMSILSLLALRIITQQRLDYFMANDSNSLIYKNVLNLIGHTEKRDVKDLLHRTLMTLFLLQLLRHGGYFKWKNNNAVNGNSSSSSDDRIVLGEEELKIGTLILKHLQILQFNAHEIYETIIPSDEVNAKGMTSYIALGLYLSSSLFNHECQPTLARYFSGKKIVLRAQRPIEANKLVSENYGFIFTMKTKEQRLTMLKGRYLFDCNCIACEKDWPKLEEMGPEINYRCKNKSCPGIIVEQDVCDSCGNRSSLDDLKVIFHLCEQNWERATSLITNGKFREAEAVVIKYIETMSNLVTQPSKNLCLAMEALRMIWANIYGNVSLLPISAKHV